MSDINKELAEWVGFIPYLRMGDGTYYGVKSPEGKIKIADYPEFTKDFADCIKYLLPKILEEMKDSWDAEIYFTHMMNCWLNDVLDGKPPAECFCNRLISVIREGRTVE